MNSNTMKKKSVKSNKPIFPLHPSVVEHLFYSRSDWEKDFLPDSKNDELPSFQTGVGSTIARLLEFMSPMFKAKLALDLGTGLGYSAHILAEIVGPDGRVLTVERNEDLARAARENFKNCGFDKRVAILTGEVSETIKNLSGPFDLVMLDTDKNEMIDFLDQILEFLTPGGHLIVSGVNYLSKETASRQKPVVLHMARFVHRLLKTESMKSIFIPLGDGLIISRKVEDDPGNQLNMFEFLSKKRSISNDVTDEKANIELLDTEIDPDEIAPQGGQLRVDDEEIR
jgi:predicted O-methyltransferase YrrM